LTIITQSLNSSIRDAEWSVKKAGRDEKGGLRKYAEGIELLSPFLDLDDWNETAIYNRANYLAEKALTTWLSQ